MSNHSQSHQSQSHSPSIAVQPTQQRQPSASASAEVAKPKACTPGENSCGCQPSAEHIRVRAYEISQARNGGAGNASTDWSQAERELAATSAAKD